jgi:hypothetical protein
MALGIIKYVTPVFMEICFENVSNVSQKRVQRTNIVRMSRESVV